MKNSIEIKINHKISTFLGKSLDSKSLKEIRDSIKEVVSKFFISCNTNLSDDIISWIANFYFKRLKLNSDQFISEYVIFNDYKISEFSDKELKIAKKVLLGSQVESEISEELMRRKLS